MTMTLPSAFAALVPFAEAWSGETAAARDALRTEHPAAERQAFYDAMAPQIANILDVLDAVPLAEHGPAEQALMRMALTFAHVSAAVEVHGPDEAKHAATRPLLRITRAPADASS